MSDLELQWIGYIYAELDLDLLLVKLLKMILLPFLRLCN